jgi:flavin-dependent dehydrogenase
MRIGVIGARLAGSYASLLLSKIGHEVLLFDDSTEKEKPCGGGVTAKALRGIQWFRENPLPHTEIKIVRMSTNSGNRGELFLRNPIHIFSRSVLDSKLREAAIRAGSRFTPQRAVRLTAREGGWIVSTRQNDYPVDYLVGADGATSSVRSQLVGKYAAADLSLALGYYLPGEYHHNSILISFQECGFLGYIWSFPRTDHSSVGILQWLPETNARELRRRVLQFIAQHYPAAEKNLHFYAARIPCLSRRTLLQQKICGSNWALLGDAAGFTDPITAEGIHYALRSAELLATAFQQEDPAKFQELCRSDFGTDLLRAAGWRDRFYAGTLLFQAFTRRAVQIAHCSKTAQLLTDLTISGYYTYERLRRQLILNMPRILSETICSLFARSRPPVPSM